MRATIILKEIEIYQDLHWKTQVENSVYILFRQSSWLGDTCIESVAGKISDFSGRFSLPSFLVSNTPIDTTPKDDGAQVFHDIERNC